MSSPSPGPQAAVVDQHQYQTNETSHEHAHLPPAHQCSCHQEALRCDCGHAHCPSRAHAHHHVTAQGPAHQLIVPAHQVIAPAPQVIAPAQKPPHAAVCSCHLQSGEIQEVCDAGLVGGRKIEEDDRIEVSPMPPALPPRPPPRPRADGLGTLPSRTRPRDANAGSSGGGIRKYVFWCTICGGFATVLGALFLAVYFMLRSYTSTLIYFETIPTFVPATMLILTGLCVMSLARRRNRYSYLIKVCGVCCLVCALTCVLVTITTTVIHMNRLQTLRECVYTHKTRTCTCYSVLLEAHADADEGTRFVFDSTPDCEVIHGALYSCLRAMFGLSVSGILVCIFSCMLVYQLLSHERKKMYWEQLELRCRSLYQQQTNTISTQGSGRGPPIAAAPYCSCCEECRYPPVPANHVYPWDAHHTLERFWTPGRVGNFYSPNPGEDIPPPSGDGRNRERSAGGWSWRRLPWNRGNNQQSISDSQRQRNSLSYRQNVNSPDSQYGFSNRNIDNPIIASTIGDPIAGSTGSYSMLDNRPVGGVYVWGPPPPYSNPNSPARRPIHSPARYHHIHHHPHSHVPHCQMSEENQSQSSSDCQLRRPRPTYPAKDNYENTTETEIHQSNDTSENTDTSSCVDRVSNNTLPARKTKKRMDILAVKQMPNTGVRTVENINCSQPRYNDGQCEQEPPEEHSYQDANVKAEVMKNETQQCRFLPRLQGVENAAFQNQESAPQKAEPTESEVYFADVSSCCNISVRNDGQDSSLYDEALEAQKSRLMSLQCQHKQNRLNEADPNVHQSFQDKSYNQGIDTEDYLAQRIGKRQMSTRSRLPFPLPNSDNLTLSDLNSESCLQLLSKDISQNSLASVQTPMTETTDDTVSPMSPTFIQNDCCNYYPEQNAQEQQMHRHMTFSNAGIDQFLAPDAQYEIIQQQNTNNQNLRQNYPDDHCTTSAPNQQTSFSNLTNTISGLNNFGSQNFPTQEFNSGQNFNPTQNFNPNQISKGGNQSFINNPQNFTSFDQSSTKNIPPKTLNLTNSPRRGIGSNISTLIQNLGVIPVGLLYGESNSTDEEIQGQACHSDGTMDSGWQSGSEKQDNARPENPDTAMQRSVNI